MKTFKKRVRVIQITLFAAVLFGIYMLYPHLGVAFGESVNFRLYFHLKPYQITRNKYYVFQFKNENFDGYIVKKAVCLPGENVTREKNSFYCDGVYLADIYTETDAKGGKYVQFHGGTLDECIFFIGDNLHKSYDSRYFGPVHISAVAGEVYPIW